MSAGTIRATVYVSAEGEPKFVLLPDGTAREIGQMTDKSKAQLERWGAEQMFLSTLTPDQREAWTKLQKTK